jgi:hypothetical protein
LIIHCVFVIRAKLLKGYLSVHVANAVKAVQFYSSFFSLKISRFGLSHIVLVKNWFQGLADRNPFSALSDHESMTDFPPIPAVKKIENEKFPFESTSIVNPVCPAVRCMNFNADRLTSENHVGMSDLEDASDTAQSGEEKAKDKIVKKKSEKKK